jgi:hypothetical protein
MCEECTQALELECFDRLARGRFDVFLKNGNR